MTLEAALLDQPAGAAVTRRILEDAPESPLRRRLGRLALGEQLPHALPHLGGGPWLEPQASLGDHLARSGRRVPVRELEVVGVERPPPGGVDDDRLDEHRPELDAVGSRVHPDPAADRAGDRRGELEAAQVGVAGAVQADRVRGAAAREELPAVDARLGQLPFEVEDERVDPVVVHEQVRAEADGLDGDALARRPAKELLELVEAARARKPARRPPGPERREPRQGHVLLEPHQPSRSRRRAGARSTSPAPITSTTSPGRAERTTWSTPSSIVGVQAGTRPRSESASTTSLPVTPGTGFSRAG